MKLLILLAFFGLARASALDAVQQITQEATKDFAFGLQTAPSLVEYLDDSVYEDVEERIKTSLKDSFKKILQTLVDKLRDSKQKVNEAISQIRQAVQESIKQLKDNITADNIHLHLTDLLNKISDILRWQGNYDIRDLVEDFLKGLSWRNIWRLMTGQISAEEVAQLIKRAFGDSSEIGKQLLTSLKNLGVVGFWRFLASLVGKGGAPENYALSKLAKLLQWLQNAVKAGIQGAKEKLDKLKPIVQRIAQEIEEKLKNTSREVLTQLIQLLQPFGAKFLHIIEAIRQRIAELGKLTYTL